MSTDTEHEQRTLDQASGCELDRRTNPTIPSDAPVMLPTYEDLIALGDRIAADCNARLKRLGEVPMSAFSASSLRHDIVSAMIDVRHAAADYASDKTWARVHEVLR